MDTQVQKHIETVKEAFEVLHESDYNHHDLKYRLNMLIDYLQEKQRQELNKSK